jgi:DNA-binding transcriptional MerR regulator/methylmalonyl-CoA mutase cobalamin-binding subunit
MTDTALHTQRRHPMRVVIRRTGLTADVLRAWERRYGVVAPERSEGGQRLYSDEEIERLSLLRRATGAGRNISQIASLSLPELEALVAEDESVLAREKVVPGSSAQAEYYFEAALQAIQRLDGAELEALLRRAAMQLSSETTIDEVLIPLLHELGESWHRGEITPAHEHLGTAAIRRVLSWISGSAIVSHYAPTALIATPANQRHELGAKVAATTASTEGWRVAYLGCDLPADAIASAAVQSGAALVVLSMIFPVDDPNLVPEVVRIRQLVPPQVPVVAGGAAAIAHESELARHGVRVMPDLQHLRVILRSLNPASAAR